MTFMDFFFPHDNDGRSSRDSFILFEPLRGCSVCHHSKIDVLTCLQVLGGFYELQIFLFLCVAVVYVKCIKGESIYQLQKPHDSISITWEEPDSRDCGIRKLRTISGCNESRNFFYSFKQFGRFVKLLLDEHCHQVGEMRTLKRVKICKY